MKKRFIYDSHYYEMLQKSFSIHYLPCLALPCLASSQLSSLCKSNNSNIVYFTLCCVAGNLTSEYIIIIFYVITLL